MTSLLKSLSEESGIPLSTLKLNARILRDFKLVSYGSRRRLREAKLGALGAFVLSLLNSETETATITLSD